jgi:hypothetical protein
VVTTDEDLYEKLQPHTGHQPIVVVGYGLQSHSADADNLAIECLECNEVLVDTDVPIECLAIGHDCATHNGDEPIDEDAQPDYRARLLAAQLAFASATNTYEMAVSDYVRSTNPILRGQASEAVITEAQPPAPSKVDPAREIPKATRERLINMLATLRSDLNALGRILKVDGQRASDSRVMAMQARNKANSAAHRMRFLQQTLDDA